MIPQLWKRNLEWLEWRQMHPDLDDREAEYLYRVEQKMFQNYQDEIRNQMMNRQTRLVGDLMNLSADISTILNKGGVDNTDTDSYIYPDYVAFRGKLGDNYGIFKGSETYTLNKGERFIINTATNASFGSGNSFNNGNANGVYLVLETRTITQYTNITMIDVFTFEAGLNNSWWVFDSALDPTRGVDQIIFTKSEYPF